MCEYKHANHKLVLVPLQVISVHYLDLAFGHYEPQVMRLMNLYFSPHKIDHKKSNEILVKRNEDNYCLALYNMPGCMNIFSPRQYFIIFHSGLFISLISTCAQPKVFICMCMQERNSNGLQHDSSKFKVAKVFLHIKHNRSAKRGFSPLTHNYSYHEPS